jgi:hypothetical protein
MEDKRKYNKEYTYEKPPYIKGQGEGRGYYQQEKD